jgi:hypothetical protein
VHVFLTRFSFSFVFMSHSQDVCVSVCVQMWWQGPTSARSAHLFLDPIESRDMIAAPAMLLQILSPVCGLSRLNTPGRIVLNLNARVFWAIPTRGPFHGWTQDPLVWLWVLSQAGQGWRIGWTGPLAQAGTMEVRV